MKCEGRTALMLSAPANARIPIKLICRCCMSQVICCSYINTACKQTNKSTATTKKKYFPPNLAVE